MRHLPLELQLLVIENLGPKDIISLQLTSKSFHNLIEASADVIWKHCLQNHCRENELFQASFKDLRAASQFKNACTASLRLLKAYEGALAKNKAILPARKVGRELIRLTESTEEANVHDIYLMPGGRFLVTFQQLRWLSVWDLHQARPQSPTLLPKDHKKLKGFGPTLLLRHTIAPFDSLAYIDACADGNTVRFLIKVLCPVPEEAASLLANLAPGDNVDDVPAFDLLQLNMQDANASIEPLGRLIVIYPEVKYSITLSETEILFLTEESTMIWNSSKKQASVWIVDDIPEICGVFTFSNYILYITAEGVHGVEMPPFEPLDNDWVALPTKAKPLGAITLRPSFCIPHEIKHSIDSGNQVSGPNVCNARLRARHAEVFYEITEFKPLKDANGLPTTTKKDQISVYRYLFAFNPTHPAQSTLKLTESAALCRPPGSRPRTLPPGEEVDLVPGPYQYSDRRLGCIWMEDIGNDDEGWRARSLHFSLSSPFERSPWPMQVQAPALLGPRTRNKWRFGSNNRSSFVQVTKLGLVKFWDSPSCEDEDPESVLACEFCPSTGRVAILSDGDDGTWVTIFDLFGTVSQLGQPKLSAS